MFLSRRIYKFYPIITNNWPSLSMHAEFPNETKIINKFENHLNNISAKIGSICSTDIFAFGKKWKCKMLTYKEEHKVMTIPHMDLLFRWERNNQKNCKFYNMNKICDIITQDPINKFDPFSFWARVQMLRSVLQSGFVTFFTFLRFFFFFYKDLPE